MSISAAALMGRAGMFRIAGKPLRSTSVGEKVREADFRVQIRVQ
jgi:hypothetical protein